MSDNSNERGRTALEDVMKNVLSGDVLKNALDLASYFVANDMLYGEAHGDISYEGQCVCYIYLDGADKEPGPWTVWTEGDYSAEYPEVPMDGRMKEIAWSHVNFCADCGGKCSPGQSKMVFGRAFDNVCGATMAFNNPGGEAADCLKKLLEMRKYAILRSVGDAK